MLIEFKFKNSRSFYSEQEFSMVASNIKDLPENTISLNHIPSLKNVSGLKSAVIYGSNASGKSGFIISMLNAILIIKNSFKYDPGQTIFRQSFHSKERINEETSYLFDFIVDDIRYIYSFACNSQHILNESLLAYTKGKPQRWFSRKRERDNSYSWEINKGKSWKKEDAIKDLTMENVLFLSRAATLDSERLKPVFNWFSQKFNILFLSSGMGLSPELTDKMIIENNAKRIELLQFMKKADFGISDIQVDENTNAINSLDRIRFIHSGPDMPFTKSMESSGTNLLFCLWSPLKTVLDNGWILVVDELENSLHPLLLLEIIKLFNSTRNIKGAQLIFSSHNQFLMSQKTFRRDQIWFCEKNLEGESSIFPLSDFKIRNDFSISKGYISGRFGAIPNIIDPLI